jgi:hypothetical protein
MNIQMFRDEYNDKNEMKSSYHDHDNLHHVFSFKIYLKWLNVDRV